MESRLDACLEAAEAGDAEHLSMLDK